MTWNSRKFSVASLALLLAAATWVSPANSQSSTNPPSDKTQQQQPDQSSPDAGGPGGDNGAIAIPKKPEKPDVPPPPPEPTVKNPPGLANFSLRVDVPEVTVDVGVILQKTHEFVPNLQPANFRVYEDGVPQKVIGFKRTKAPITAVLLCEFASTNYWFVYDMRNAAYAFARQLQPDDYVAVATYDLKTQILTDFTQDKRLVYESLNSLVIPGFSETDMFDAVYNMLDRMSRIEGRKYLILIGSGYDSFSKINLDKVLAKIKATPNVTIFSVGTGQAARITGNARSGMFGPKEIDYLQADNQMSTFARMTGGMSFFPRFAGEMPDIFHAINDSIRNQYVLTYTPSNAKQDGTYRKIRVELVDNEGQPLKMQDEKHHSLKYDIITRDGYRAKQQVD
ncbi:MAG TPA: VWA domain-containing protein [Acidobacteriaceae bacterium]|nr:VWA domain-containing protein [Acidobacteriaceae bacterium]